MANKKNLKPIQSVDEAREKGKKGGIKSGEVRRERKALKEELLYLLERGDTQEKISLALIKQALEGNVKAFAMIRDTIGEKPVEKQEITEIEKDIQRIYISESECCDTEEIIKKLKFADNKIINFIPKEDEIKFQQYYDAVINGDPKTNELVYELFGDHSEKLINLQGD